MNTTMTTLPDLETIAASLRNGLLSCTDLVSVAIESRSRSNDPVGPYVAWNADAAKRQAAAVDLAFKSGFDSGPLQGIPASVKDLFGVHGFPTYAGTSLPLPTCWQNEGTIVSRLRKQMCVVMGKTHMVELAFGGLGVNAHWGTPRNPRDSIAHRVPGGSSSGAGVGLVEGSTLFALATDTAGSVRIPASMTGTAGLKTTVGRWPTDGTVPLSSTFDSIGVLARSVRDLVFVFDAIEESLGREDKVRARPLSTCRLGVPERMFRENLSIGIDNAFERGLRELERAGAKLLPFEMTPADEAYGIFRQGGLAGAEVAAFIEDALPDRMESLDPTVQDRVRSASMLSATEYISRKRRLLELSRIANCLASHVDALVVPTVALSPPLLSELADLDNYRRCNMLALRNTSVANLLSLCAMTFPVGLDGLGMPTGMQLVGRAGSDSVLLSIGLEAEKHVDQFR